MLCTWSIFQVKRQQYMLLNCIICISVIASAFFVSYAFMRDSAAMGCSTPSTFVQQTDGIRICTVQSALLIFFVNAAIFWWCSIAIDLYLKIVLSVKHSLHFQHKMNIFYTCCSYGLALLFWLIAVSNNGLGRGKTVIWCFISEAAPNWLEWAIFYYPLVGVSVICSYCIIHTLVVMIRSSTNVYRQQTQPRSQNDYESRVPTPSYVTRATFCGKIRWLIQYMRPIAFVANFLFVFSFILGYRLVTYFQSGYYFAAAERFIHCIMTTPPSMREELCGHRTEHPHVIILFFVTLCVAGQGVLCFLLYGTQNSNFILWYGLLTGKGTHFSASQVLNQSAQQAEIRSRLRQTEMINQQRQSAIEIQKPCSPPSINSDSVTLEQLILTTPNMTEQAIFINKRLHAVSGSTPLGEFNTSFTTRPSSARSSILNTADHQQPFLTKWNQAHQNDYSNEQSTSIGLSDEQPNERQRLLREDSNRNSSNAQSSSIQTTPRDNYSD